MFERPNSAPLSGQVVQKPNCDSLASHIYTTTVCHDGCLYRWVVGSWRAHFLIRWLNRAGGGLVAARSRNGFRNEYKMIENIAGRAILYIVAILGANRQTTSIYTKTLYKLTLSGVLFVFDDGLSHYTYRSYNLL